MGLDPKAYGCICKNLNLKGLLFIGDLALAKKQFLIQECKRAGLIEGVE